MPSSTWLHIKIGQILASLEGVRDTMTEMRDEASALRTSHGSMREEVAGLVSKIDHTCRRIAEVETDIEPLGGLASRMTTIERDVHELKPRVERMESLRNRAIGAMLVISAIAFALEMARDVVTIHVGMH
jgi:archaellum component FlaC